MYGMEAQKRHTKNPDDHLFMKTSRCTYTLKTGTPVEDGDPISKLLRGVSCPEIQLGAGIHELENMHFFR